MIEFFFGIAIYRYLPLIKNRARAIILLLLSSFLLVFLYQYYPQAISQSLSARPFAGFNLLSGLAYAGLMASLLAWQTITPNNYPKIKTIAVFCGGLSYAVYLFHEITIRWLLTVTINSELRVFLALCVTLLLAWAVNKLVEIPFREYGRK